MITQFIEVQCAGDTKTIINLSRVSYIADIFKEDGKTSKGVCIGLRDFIGVSNEKLVEAKTLNGNLNSYKQYINQHVDSSIEFITLPLFNSFGGPVISVYVSSHDIYNAIPLYEKKNGTSVEVGTMINIGTTIIGLPKPEHEHYYCSILYSDLKDLLITKHQ